MKDTISEGMDEDDRKSRTQAPNVRKRLDREHKKRMKASQTKRRNDELKEVSVH